LRDRAAAGRQASGGERHSPDTCRPRGPLGRRSRTPPLRATSHPLYGALVRPLWPTLLLFSLVSLAAAPLAAEDEKPRLLVMNLEAAGGISEEDALTLTQLVTVEASDIGVFRTVSYKDLQTMVALEGDRQALGCADTSCLADLAGAIGARFVIYGRVSKLGSRTILQLNLIDSEAAKPLAREAAKASDLGQLADQLPTIVGAVIHPALRIINPKVAEARETAATTARPTPTPAPEPDPQPQADPFAAATGLEPIPLEEVSDLSIVAGDPPELKQIRSTTKIDGVQAIAGTEATFVVEGTPDEVMDALWQKEALHEVLPGGASTEIKRDGKDKTGRRWVEAILRDKIILVRTSYTVRLIRDDKRMLLTFNEVEGDVKYARGRFRLQPAPQDGYTIVTYRLIFSVGMMVPSSWSRRALNDQPAEMAKVVRERVQQARKGDKKTAAADKKPEATEKADKASDKKSKKKKKSRRKKRRR
jgi:TolB-like protein